MKMDETRKKAITYSIRALLQNKDLQGMAKELYQKRQSEKEVSIYLPLANDCANKIISGAAVNMEDFDIDCCFNLKDTTLLGELEKLKVLSVKLITEGDDSAGNYIGFVAFVKINNPKFIEQVNEWAEDAYYSDLINTFEAGQQKKNTTRNNIGQREDANKLIFYKSIGKVAYCGKEGKKYEAELNPEGNPFKLLIFLAKRPNEYFEPEKLDEAVLNPPRGHADHPLPDRRVRDTIREIRKQLKLKREDDFFLINKCRYGVKCSVELRP